jgi:hypothetical protein
MLKMRQEHIEAIRTGMMAVLEGKREAIEAAYLKAGYSNMRLNWDILWASMIEGKRSCFWLSDLYRDESYVGGLNDTHINSALAHIMGNDGTDRNGKKR